MQLLLYWPVEVAFSIKLLENNGMRADGSGMQVRKGRTGFSTTNSFVLTKYFVKIFEI